MGRSLKSGNVDAMLDAIALGVDVDSRDETRSKALMWAASNGWPECVEALIARGAATDLGDYQGVQALSMAAARGKISCVEMLLDAGCRMPDALSTRAVPEARRR